MGVGRAQRIARRVHRGVITADGELVTEFLDRVAGRVAELGGGWAARQAAWLHLVQQTDESLAGHRIPGRVLRVLDALRPRHHTLAADRSLRDDDATLVHYVLMEDLYRHRRGHFTVEPDPRIARKLGLPWPPPGPDRGRKRGRTPFDGSDLAEFAELLGEYRTAGPAERETIRSDGRVHHLATRPLVARSPLGTELIEQWWNSTDPWECHLAMCASRVANRTPDREDLLVKAASVHIDIAREAIIALRGPGDTREIELLGAVVARPGEKWRWTRAAAATRLRDIGGPTAEAALRERAYTWNDAP